MAKYLEWVEPWGVGQKQTLICRMSLEDVLAFQRSRSEYDTLSDIDCIEDFMVVHWAREIDDGI